MNFSYSFPAVKGIQANKNYYIAMVPLKYIVKIFPEPTEYVPPEYRAQRKLNEQRIPEIRNYILENRDTYIFSSLTASIDGNFSFNEIQNNVGILQVDMEAKILINDGQHRRAAIAQALIEDSSLENETISVVFFEDQGLENSQQMFSDLNMNAQKSSNSINTCFETRDELAVLTKKIVSGIPFLAKYTDFEKDNLGMNSSKLFTLYNLYRVNKLILRKEEVNEENSKFLYVFWQEIVKNLPEWEALEKKELTKRDLRENYITTLGVTLLAFSRVGIWLYDNCRDEINTYIYKFRGIDWTRHNVLWKNRMIRNDGKIINNRDAVILTGNVIKKELGMPLTREEENKEDMVR